MTTNVTSPALYAVGTVTTVVSFVVIIAGAGLDRRSSSAGARARRATLTSTE